MAIRGVRRALNIPRLTGRSIGRDIDEEIAFHVARRAEQLCAAGMPHDQAYAEAARRFGDIASLRDECIDIDRDELRRERFMDVIDHTLGDLRFALRSFRRSPAFTAVALLTLVTGIAALTSIFSYFNAVYYSKLPYHDADRIVAISEQRPSGFRQFSAVSLDALPLVRGATRSFERMSVYGDDGAFVLFGTEPQAIRVLDVDTAFVPLFALRPQIGRLLAPEEILANAPVAMISDDLWRTHYGADRSALGERLLMNARSFTIVGVMPPGFRFPWQTDAIVPLREAADSASTRERNFAVLGKLRPGATRDQARQELAVIAPRLARIDAKTYQGTQLIVRDEMLDRKTNQFLPLPSVFLGAGLFLLFIACANVTSLFYVRAAERSGEMAIRASLGARRPRLIRQALTECLLLSGVAAVLGTWFAMLLVRLWLHFVPTQGFPSWFHVSVDVRVLMFSIAVTALVTVVVGLSPARAGTRFDLVQTLKQAGDGGMSSSHAMRGSKRGLVLQLALSVALFVGGALLVRSFQHLLVIDVGYPAAKIAMVMPFFERTNASDPGAGLRFSEQVVEQSAHMAGLTDIAIRGSFRQLREAPGVTPKRPPPFSRPYRPGLIPDGDTSRAVGVFSQNYRQYVVSDNYFEMLGLKLHAGRAFGQDDVLGKIPSAIVSAHAAKLLWGSQSAIGRSVRIGGTDDVLAVIGVVDDVHDLTGGGRGFNADAGITIYVSTRQALASNPALLATGTGDLAAVRSKILETARRIDPLVIFGRETTMASQLDEAFMVTKVFGGVVVALAASALFLSVIGIYGVVAFGVAQRTREIGIRIALGGTSSDILRMVTTEAFRFVGVGLGVGLVLSIAVSRLIKIVLFGVSPLDPITYVVVSVGFGFVALVACYVPARRVTRVDPVAALRAE